MSVLCISVASVALAETGPRSASQRHSSGKPTLKLHKMVEPIYPEAALKNGIRGTVVVEVLIDKQGVPQAVHALRGDPTLVNTVSQAIQQWRWQPYRLNRQAIAVEMMIAVNFEPEMVEEPV
ncbi:MAG: energy transducer TonB [Acidobacteriia bacterium]|nr:energy transducer TonB [Terriglobia bacterium]